MTHSFPTRRSSDLDTGQLYLGRPFRDLTFLQKAFNTLPQAGHITTKSIFNLNSRVIKKHDRATRPLKRRIVMASLYSSGRESPLVLTVPGLNNSGPGHWQPIWETTRNDCERVDLGMRSEERRVGKESVSTCRSGWWPYH